MHPGPYNLNKTPAAPDTTAETLSLRPLIYIYNETHEILVELKKIDKNR